MKQEQPDQTCPQCRYRGQQHRIEERGRLEAAYGKMPSAEWLEMWRLVPESTGDYKTMYHEFSALMSPSGDLDIYYRASCQVCKFEHVFKHSDVMPPPKADK